MRNVRHKMKAMLWMWLHSCSPHSQLCAHSQTLSPSPKSRFESLVSYLFTQRIVSTALLPIENEKLIVFHANRIGKQSSIYFDCQLCCPLCACWMISQRLSEANVYLWELASLAYTMIVGSLIVRILWLGDTLIEAHWLAYWELDNCFSKIVSVHKSRSWAKLIDIHIIANCLSE